MAKITDPDDLVRDTHVSFNTGTKRITVTATGILDPKDGVSLKALYSFCKEEWKTDATLIPFPFPWTPITDEQFELINGWDFFNDTSRYLIRDGGWSVVDATTGLPNAQWAGIISLGTLETNDQPYFQQAGGAPVNFQTQGVINQAIQIFKDVDADGVQEGGDFDYRTSLRIFGREQAQVYGSSALADIGVTTMSYQAYRFPLATAADLNITTSDGTIAASSPYTEIAVRYFPTAFAKDVDAVGTPRNFGIVIDVGTHSGVDGSVTNGGNTLTSAEAGIDLTLYDGGTLTIHEGTSKGVYTIGNIAAAGSVPITGTFPATESGLSFTLQRAAPVTATRYQIYEKVQYLLRQSADIDATSGTNTGKTASELLEFVGPTLKAGTKIPINHRAGGSGVVIMGFSANDTNELQFVDNVGATRTYPFVAAGSINFNDNLQADQEPSTGGSQSSSYWMFYEYTERFTNTGFALSAVSGQNATLTSSTTSLVAELTNGDYIRLGGFTNSGNNGIWVLTGAPAGTGPWTAAVQKVDSLAPTNEAAGPTVSLDKNPIDSADAIVVDNNAGNDIAGSVTGPSIGFDFDYDNNVQGGRTAGTPAAVVIRAIGLARAQFVEARGTITRATGQAFTLVSPLERNYAE